MKKETPPETARRPGQRTSKFAGLRADLLADVGQWYNITDDLPDGKPEEYFAELARSISAGNRAAFKPRGFFEARAEGRQVWARAVPEDQRPQAAAAAADIDDDAEDQAAVGF